MSFTIPQPKELGLSKRERKNYSLLNALGHIQKGNWDALGLEGECSRAIENRVGKPPKGLYVPTEIGWGQRDLSVGSATAGGNLVGTDHSPLGDRFIDALRAKSIIFDIGARRMSGLVGDVAIPALNAKTTAYWVAENGAPTEGAPTVRQITMSPKTVGCYVDLSRRLMLQSDPSAEGIFRGDMVAQIASAIDSAAINGSGSSNQPTGILNTSGIGSVAIGTNGGAPTWGSVVNLIKEVAVSNGEQGSRAFITSPAASAKLRSVAKVSGTDSKMILDDRSELFGYRVISSSLVPSNLTKGTGSSLSAMIFGNFNDLVIGEWGGLDVLFDPYTGSNTGAMRVTAFMDVDVAVRHAESFAAISDLVTT
jgi:HK97 family phage major capsid protein